jgi:hypothetical protein
MEMVRVGVCLSDAEARAEICEWSLTEVAKYFLFFVFAWPLLLLPD